MDFEIFVCINGNSIAKKICALGFPSYPIRKLLKARKQETEK